MKTVFLFPGQGAQFVGMAKDLFDASKAVRELFEKASDATGQNMAKLLFESSEDDLKITSNTQAAVTLHNLASSLVLAERGIKADICAGFSVGEYSALYESGILAFDGLWKAVNIRGDEMEKGSRKHDSATGPCGMSAILGMSIDDALPVLKPLEAKGVFIANHSSPTQIVLGGTFDGLGLAEAALTEAGAMRVVRLKVSGPFHTPLLADAAASFGYRVKAAGITFNLPKIPIISNVTAKPIKDGAEANELAIKQIQKTVLWVDSMASLKAEGEIRVFEVGPGKVLSGLWKSFTKDVKCNPAGTIADIDALGA